MDTFYIDVREEDEFDLQHIEGAMNTPLSKFDSFVEPVLQIVKSFKLVIVCKSGLRSTTALNQLKKHSKDLPEVEVLEGGIDKWASEGKSLVGKSAKSSLPIIRQVMTIAGFLILIGALGSLYLKHELIWLTLFVGAGLSFAGISGICFMAKMLAHMPWNK